jgi:hypothetical protein
MKEERDRGMGEERKKKRKEGRREGGRERGRRREGGKKIMKRGRRKTPNEKQA